MESNNLSKPSSSSCFRVYDCVFECNVKTDEPIEMGWKNGVANSKSVKKQPGPRCKTEGFPPKQAHSPLKLTIKRLSTCHEPAFEVVNKKKPKHRGTAMDDMIPEGPGGISPHPQTPSPTPSDVLRQEVNADTHRSSWETLAYSFGFLAPEPLEVPASQEVEGEARIEANGKEQENGHREDSGTSSNGEPESSELSIPPATDTASDDSVQVPSDRPVQNGISESEPDVQKGTESSDSGCEKDGNEDFPGSDNLTTTMPSPPPTPKGLTILAPSALNNTVVSSSLPSPLLDNNTETYSSLNMNSSAPNPPPPAPEKTGLIIKSAEALGVSLVGSVNLLNIATNNNDPLGIMRGFDNFIETCEVCGDRSGNLEQHRATMGHYKCQVGPECVSIVFPTAAELTTHQQITHGIATPPPTQPSLQQLQQQVQRIPVPYGIQPPLMGTPPPTLSPGYRIPGGITLTFPSTAGQVSPSSTPTLPMQGSIQARPFAMATSPSTMRPDGSPVTSPALPTNLGRSISISPSIKSGQKRATSSPVVETAKRSRPDSPDCELVDVQQPLPALPRSISLTVRGSNEPATPVNKPSSGVANILASRGITVTPAVNKPSTPPAPRTNSSQPVTSLNLGSAVSIVPANQARSQFAVPQGRSVNRQVSNQVRPPTVDLTTTPDNPPSRRNRPQRFTCQVCDKVFQSQETLNQHLTTHRSPGKLPYKCTLCNAQYPTQQGLLQHKQTYHKEAQGSEMALPVVDMKHPATMQKLSSLGIRHCLILSQLTNSSGGVFGIPIVAIDNARNPAVCNLGALGASNVLSLGPAKALR